MDQQTVINTLMHVKAICAATRCCTYCPFDSICLCPVNEDMPENWDKVVAFSEAPRGTYSEIRDARPDQGVVRQAMLDFIQNCRIENCIPQTDYIQSLGLEAK